MGSTEDGPRIQICFFQPPHSLPPRSATFWSVDPAAFHIPKGSFYKCSHKRSVLQSTEPSCHKWEWKGLAASGHAVISHKLRPCSSNNLTHHIFFQIGFLPRLAPQNTQQQGQKSSHAGTRELQAWEQSRRRTGRWWGQVQSSSAAMRSHLRSIYCQHTSICGWAEEGGSYSCHWWPSLAGQKSSAWPFPTSCEANASYDMSVALSTQHRCMTAIRNDQHFIHNSTFQPNSAYPKTLGGSVIIFFLPNLPSTLPAQEAPNISPWRLTAIT